LNDKHFSAPVRLRIAPNRERVVSTAWEGVECLRDWPADRGKGYRSALRACHDALEGWTSTAKARRALQSDAREARLLD